RKAAVVRATGHSPGTRTNIRTIAERLKTPRAPGDQLGLPFGDGAIAAAASFPDTLSGIRIRPPASPARTGRSGTRARRRNEGSRRCRGRVAYLHGEVVRGAVFDRH